MTTAARLPTTPLCWVAGRRRHRRSAGFRTASTARLSSRTPSVAASAATATPAHARSSTPPCSCPWPVGFPAPVSTKAWAARADGRCRVARGSARLRLLAGSRLLCGAGGCAVRARAGEVAEHAALIVGVFVGLVRLGLGLFAVGHSASIPSCPTDACAIRHELRNSWRPSVLLNEEPGRGAGFSMSSRGTRSEFSRSKWLKYLDFKKYSG